jgi:hypothetical protein
MPELARRRYLEGQYCCTMCTSARSRAASATPGAHEGWQWQCGLYPGSDPAEQYQGVAETFDQARADFEDAWQDYLPKRTEADFQAWRDQRWTARKYARWERGERFSHNRQSDEILN